VPSFYRIIHGCYFILSATCFCFSIHRCQIRAVAMAFRLISSNGVIDGMLMKIQTPSSSKAGLFSGHYQTYGITVQAVYNA
jgi:hypothetical protein